MRAAHVPTLGLPVTRSEEPAVDAVIPLAVLEAMRALDAPTKDELDEYHPEWASKRLGMSRTVEQQITRYRDLAARGRRLTGDEPIQLLALAGRRSDAAVVFTDAGRRAARYAAARAGAASSLFRRALPGALRRRAGFRAARRIAQDVFGITVTRDGTGIAAVATQPVAVKATPEGAACALYGAALTTLLSELTGFDGAMQHESCRARGSVECRWHSAPAA